MFIRWKDAGKRQSAYLVKSVRIDGKPRHETIASLCSMQKEQGNTANAWVKFERAMQALDLDEQERAQIYRSFELKVPRPSQETIEQEAKTLAGWDAYFARLKANVVPDNPPVRTDMLPYSQNDTGLAIKWTVEQPRPKAGVSAKYTASLLKPDGEVVRLGTIEKQDLNGDLVSYRYDFWYQVHSALCLANVDYETYETALQMLDTWVELPPRETFIRLMLNKQQWAENSMQSDLKATYKKMTRLHEKDRDLTKLRKRGDKYLSKMLRSDSNVSK